MIIYMCAFALQNRYYASSAALATYNIYIYLYIYIPLYHWPRDITDENWHFLKKSFQEIDFSCILLDLL
jgi:hypothetical protein